VGLEARGAHESHPAPELKTRGAYLDAPERFREKGASAPFSFSRAAKPRTRRPRLITDTDHMVCRRLYEHRDVVEGFAQGARCETTAAAGGDRRTGSPPAVAVVMETMAAMRRHPLRHHPPR
jgi:hypothetical protein